MLLAAVLMGAGYFETRLYPDAPGADCITWAWALLIFVAAIGTATNAGMIRLVLAPAAFLTGIVLIGWYYRAYRDKANNA